MFKGKFKDIVLKDDGFLRGPFGSALKKSLFVEKGKDTYKVYEQGVVLQKNKNIGNYYISNDYFKKELERFEVKTGDFLVSCSGVNYGAIYQLTGEIEKGVINQALLRIRINKEIVDEKFFYYYFKTYIAKKITEGTGDSTIPNFPPMSYVKNIDVEVPNMEIQKKIGKILGNIDNKIHNNNNINTNLEEMVKTIYNYWFLQYEFPNDKGKPYKSSGGKMIWNKELKKEVPENWEIIKTIDRFNYIKGVEPGSKEYKEGKKEGFLKFYRVGDIDDSGNTYVSKEYAKIANVSKNELLVTFDGTVGKIGIGLEGVYSTGMKKISDKKNEIDVSVIWTLFKSDRFQSIIRKYATGSNILHASSSIPYLNFEYDETVYKKYEKIIKPIYNEIIQNKIENKELKSLRNYLLPYFMNGQISFKNL